MEQLAVLAVDASGPVLSVALSVKGQLWEVNGETLNRHAEELTCLVDELLKQVGFAKTAIDLFTAPLGPGSFMGLRIGLTAVKGMALALNKPVVAVPTLDAYAQALEGTHRCVVLDARKDRFYLKLFPGLSEVMDVNATQACTILQDATIPWVATGYGAELLAQKLAELNFRLEVSPQAGESKAAFLIPMALEIFAKNGADDLSLGPWYLRLSEAELSLMTRGER
jgi:tRNA threonylcarbamoyladenosine biosynthesis protein TsaB